MIHFHPYIQSVDYPSISSGQAVSTNYYCHSHADRYVSSSPCPTTHPVKSFCEIFVSETHHNLFAYPHPEELPLFLCAYRFLELELGSSSFLDTASKGVHASAVFDRSHYFRTKAARWSRSNKIHEAPNILFCSRSRSAPPLLAMF